MSSQGSLNSGRQGRGLKRSAEDETIPTAKRVVHAVGSNLIMLFRDMSVSATQTAPSAEGIARAVDFNMDSDMDFDMDSDTEEVSTSSTPMDSDTAIAFRDIPGSSTRPRRPAKHSVRAVGPDTTREPLDTSVCSTQSIPLTGRGVSAVNSGLSRELEKMSLSSSTSLRSPAKRSATAIHSDTKMKLQDMSASAKFKPSEGVTLMEFPSEFRLNILSHALSNAAGPAGSISINPRAKILSDPSGVFHRANASEDDQTKWQARRGLLQTCHKLREEALEVLCRENTFFVRMSQFGKTKAAHWFEKGRFEKWLKAVGGDEEIQSVRKVTFGVEWSARVEEGLGWVDKMGKGDMRVSFFRSKVTVGGSPTIVECSAAPIEQVDALIKKLMVGEGLGYVGWMAIWDKVEEIMMSGWDVRPKKRDI
jgi:hypothetical protein